jgi:hypothetical protein
MVCIWLCQTYQAVSINLGELHAMTRFGLLYLREGQWQGQQLPSKDFVRTARATDPEIRDLPEHDVDGEHGDASQHYGLLWWNNADEALPKVPRDAYWTWGLCDSLIVVIPSLDIVVARAGKSWARKKGGQHYDALAQFLNPIAASVITSERPQSPVIAGIDWAPSTTIIRKAKGGDNWPITWGDNDKLYSAYGDGYGFAPMVKKKLRVCFITLSCGRLQSLM